MTFVFHEDKYLFSEFRIHLKILDKIHLMH